VNFDNCRDCGQTIRWANKQDGKSMPIDPAPSRHGYIRLASENGVDRAIILRGQRLFRARAEGEKLYQSHVTTCEAREQEAS